jgi:hypothetical protein
MILLAVHINNPNDVPGKITLQFENQQQCEQTLRTLTYKLKFDTFKVEGKCQKIV